VSIAKSVTILCDGDGCDASYPPDNFSPGTAAEHREYLHREGWRTLAGGRDLCEFCADVINNQKET
jgi:hypothetical protein